MSRERDVLSAAGASPARSAYDADSDISLPQQSHHLHVPGTNGKNAAAAQEPNAVSSVAPGPLGARTTHPQNEHMSRRSEVEASSVLHSQELPFGINVSPPSPPDGASVIQPLLSQPDSAAEQTSWSPPRAAFAAVSEQPATQDSTAAAARTSPKGPTAAAPARQLSATAIVSAAAPPAAAESLSSNAVLSSAQRTTSGQSSATAAPLVTSDVALPKPPTPKLKAEPSDSAAVASEPVLASDSAAFAATPQEHEFPPHPHTLNTSAATASSEL